MSAATDAPRQKTFLLARHEARVLDWIARRLPRRVLPDHMTLLGVLAAAGIGAAYWLSHRDPAWLWVASGLLVVHWLGYGRIGPTEARLGLLGLNLAILAGATFELLGLTVIDLVGLGVAALMLVTLVLRAARNLRVPALREPPGGVGPA